jgi:hypothetical protein
LFWKIQSWRLHISYEKIYRFSVTPFRISDEAHPLQIQKGWWWMYFSMQLQE